MKIRLADVHLPERDLRAAIDQDSLEELADSLRDHGQLQPIGVVEHNTGSYEVVYGARRTRAAKMIGWDTIEAHIIERTGDDNNAAKKLIENVQRENLTPIEEAYGLLDLIGDGEADVRSLQRQTGKSRDWIKGRLALLDLPDDMQGAVQAGVISLGVARALGTIENDDIRQQYLKYAIENGVTADQAAIWAGQAEFAATGMMTMQHHDQLNTAIASEPQVVDQHYSCFRCAELKSWRQVNTLVLCGPCQNDIATGRQQR